MRPTSQSWNQPRYPSNDQAPAGFPYQNSNVLPPFNQSSVPPRMPASAPQVSISNYNPGGTTNSDDWGSFFPSPIPQNLHVSDSSARGLYQIDHNGQSLLPQQDHNFREQPTGGVTMHSNYHQSGSSGFHAGASYSNGARRTGGAGRDNYARTGRDCRDNRDNRGNRDNRDGRDNRPRQRSNAPAPNLQLRDITPVKEALREFADESQIMSRLSAFISTSGRASPLQSRRQDVLDFAGFHLHQQLTYDSILTLNKQNLEALANALAAPLGGRKIDIARQIGEALRAPLKCRRSVGRRGHEHGNGYGNVAQPDAFGHQGPPPALNSNGNRASMPGFNVNGHNAYPNRNQRTYTMAMSESGATQRNPTKRPKNLPEMLRNEGFMVAENPFNVPLGSPLGNPHVAWFTAADLTQGRDPFLRFVSPPPPPDLSDVTRKGSIEVHLRCLLMNANMPVSQWKQSWPFPTAAKINNTGVQLSQAQRYTNGKLAGIDRATNISQYLHTKTSGMNVVTLRRQTSTASSATGTFILFAQQVLVQSTATMERMVKENTKKYWAEQRRMRVAAGVDENVSNFELARLNVVDCMNSNDEIAVDSMKVGLRCPLSIIPISTPVKSSECDHVQCFDLRSFLSNARHTSKFNCPVCNKQMVHPSSLIICPYLEHALEEHKGSDDVEIFADGSMTPVAVRKSGVSSDTEDDEADQKSALQKQIAANGGKAKAMAVVDLTLDSDEEDAGAEEESAPVPQEGNTATADESNQVAGGAAQEENDWNEPEQEEGHINFAVTFGDDEATPFQHGWGDYSEHDSSLAGESPGRGTAVPAPMNVSTPNGMLSDGLSGSHSNSQANIIVIDSD